MDKQRIAIFASGRGTNAAKIMDHFSNSALFEVAFLLGNKENIGALEEARKRNIQALRFSNEQLATDSFLLDICTNQGIDCIVLAGFLRKIPSALIQHFPNKIFNIHPSLLPAFGGPGMYGVHVHKAVLDKKAKVSGITIHFVNENYDEGQIIAQFHTVIDPNETLESLGEKISKLEHNYYAHVIDSTLKIAKK
jgi:phosphoribosylglycinamide formyltransferase-1